MADGPRALRADEWQQLDALVSTVFRSTMFANFPQLFNESNRENLRVVAEDNKVVCHVGMIQRQASMLGCRQDVGCIGAVATYPESRGHGYASQAFQDSCDLAAASGCDLMLISGGRGLYTRVGCREVGKDWNVTIDAATVQHGRLPAVEGLRMQELDASHIPALEVLYQTEAVRFLRPREDWAGALSCRTVMAGHADFWGMFLDDRLIAYVIVQPPHARRWGPRPASARVVEFAGDRTAIISASAHLIAQYQTDRVEMHVQEWDIALKTRLEHAGLSLESSSTWGTIRVLNFVQCMERFRPLLAERLGATFATSLRFEADQQPGSAHGGFTIRSGDQALYVPDLGTLATFLFGASSEVLASLEGDRALGATLANALPLPTLWYGITYV